MSRRRPFLVLLTTLGVSLVAACLGSTGNDRFTFEARIGGVERDTSQPLTFTNTRDWTVTLHQATATIGPVYLNTLRPVNAASTARLWDWLVPDAHASESHLGSGLIVGEVLGQLTVDLLSPTLVPFTVPGSITGDTVRSAEIFYYPPPGVAPEVPTPTEPGTGRTLAALTVAGVAVRGEQTIPFRGNLVLDSAWQRGGQPGSRDFTPITSIRQVRGIPTTFIADEGGHLEIRVDAAAMLRNADFAQIAVDNQPRDPVDPSVLLLRQGTKDGTDQVMRSLYEGLTASVGTYAVRWVSPSR